MIKLILPKLLQIFTYTAVSLLSIYSFHSFSTDLVTVFNLYSEYQVKTAEALSQIEQATLLAKNSHEMAVLNLKNSYAMSHADIAAGRQTISFWQGLATNLTSAAAGLTTPLFMKFGLGALSSMPGISGWLSKVTFGLLAAPTPTIEPGVLTGLVSSLGGLETSVHGLVGNMEDLTQHVNLLTQNSNTLAGQLRDLSATTGESQLNGLSTAPAPVAGSGSGLTAHTDPNY